LENANWYFITFWGISAAKSEKALDNPLWKVILETLSISKFHPLFRQERELTVSASMAGWNFGRCTVGIQLPCVLYLFTGRLLTRV